MQPVRQSVPLKFRASPILADLLHKRARESGVNLSEYIRSIAREKVGLS